MLNRTSLYSLQQSVSAKFVPFHGWELPLHYGSQLNEHLYVRRDAGVFDVSHMTIVDINGQDATDFLRYLLTNDVAKIKPGKALYTCMLNDRGGILDDLIVYQLTPENYRLVCNAATREKDLAWLQQQQTQFNVTIVSQPDLAILAVQGPQAIAKTTPLLPSRIAEKLHNLAPFHLITDEAWLCARTGYTGEDGLEIILPPMAAEQLWQQLLSHGVKPCGLAARDTLRLEAGLNLYGIDMDESTTPLEASLAWTIAWEDASRQFIGKKALLQQREQGISQRLIGLVLTERGVLRNHQRVVIPADGEGQITSGSFSPTLQCGIALAMLPANIVSDECVVMVHGKSLSAKIVRPPFVRHGRSVYKTLK